MKIVGYVGGPEGKSSTFEVQAEMHERKMTEKVHSVWAIPYVCEKQAPARPGCDLGAFPSRCWHGAAGL